MDDLNLIDYEAFLLSENLIANGSFLENMNGWRENKTVTNASIQHQPGKVIVNTGTETNYGVVYDINISPGEYNVAFKIKPKFLQYSTKFIVCTSSGEYFFVDAENYEKDQVFQIDLLLSKDSTFIGLIFAGSGRYEISNFHFSKKMNKTISTIYGSDKLKKITGENLIKNSNFETSTLYWIENKSGGLLTVGDNRMLVKSGSQDNYGVIYNVDFEAGKYMVSFEITPSQLSNNTTNFYLFSNSGEIVSFDIQNTAIRQIFDFEITLTSKTYIGLAYRGVGEFYVNNFYLFRKGNNFISKIIKSESIINTILENQNNPDTPLSTTAEVDTNLNIISSRLTADGNTLYNFVDQYTGEFIQARKTTEINHDLQVDNKIYFKKNSNYFKRVYQYLTPEMFGAKGIGSAHDDYGAIQEMLDKGEEGCTFWFDGSKTYYNKFDNNGLFIELENRNIWKRKIGATFLFNGAKLTRRMPEWNDSLDNDQDPNNGNEGKYYTDDQTILLYLYGGKNYVLDQPNFNSAVSLGTVLDLKGNPTNFTDYAIGTCLDYGLRLENCENVDIKNGTFRNSIFPIRATKCKNLKLTDVNLMYAGQAIRRIKKDTDPATGGGIKIEECINVTMKGIYGYRNMQDTIEVEAFNKDVYFEGSSELDFANSAIILHSENVQFNWNARDVQSGCGMLILGGEVILATRNISGILNVDTCSWAGLKIYSSNTQTDIEGINVTLQTRNCKKAGLWVENSHNIALRGINISHTSITDGTNPDGSAQIFENKIEGKISGSIYNTNNGTTFKGLNDINNCLRFDVRRLSVIHNYINTTGLYHYQEVQYLNYP